MASGRGMGELLVMTGSEQEQRRVTAVRSSEVCTSVHMCPWRMCCWVAVSAHLCGVLRVDPVLFSGDVLAPHQALSRVLGVCLVGGR